MTIPLWLYVAQLACYLLALRFIGVHYSKRLKRLTSDDRPLRIKRIKARETSDLPIYLIQRGRIRPTILASAKNEWEAVDALNRIIQESK